MSARQEPGVDPHTAYEFSVREITIAYFEDLSKGVIYKRFLNRDAEEMELYTFSFK